MNYTVLGTINGVYVALKAENEQVARMTAEALSSFHCTYMSVWSGADKLDAYNVHCELMEGRNGH